MPQKIQTPFSSDDLTIGPLTLAYQADSRSVTASFDRDYSGPLSAAPAVSIRANGETVARANSLAFVKSLSVKRRTLLEHGGPYLFRVDGYGEIDITEQVVATIPKFAGPNIQVTTLAAFAGDGSNSVRAGERAEIQIGLTNYGDKQGQRSVPVYFAGERVGEVRETIDPGEHSSTTTININVGSSLDGDVKLISGAVTILVSVEK